MKINALENGVDVLLHAAAGLLRGKQFGLIGHPASVDATGCSSATRLRERFGGGLAALFSPEHGFFGIAGAGEKVDSVLHPSWKIPVHSLYGKTRRPTAEMLKGLDAVVFDLQDLSIRCYTYVSTLRYVLEAAADHKVQVIVCERPNPLMGIVDGPMLNPRYESFVGCFPGPMVYGLTSGGAARHLVEALSLRVNLVVVPSRGGRTPAYQWISPSPAIRNPHSALCYPVTVAFEALPAIDYGRKTLMPFELIGAAGINENELAERLEKEKLPGIRFHPVVYERDGKIFHGVRVAVIAPTEYQPVASSVAVLSVLQKMIGKNKLWKTTGSRAAFFDKLFGTDSVRLAIQSDIPWRTISRKWKPGIERWKLGVARPAAGRGLVPKGRKR